MPFLMTMLRRVYSLPQSKVQANIKQVHVIAAVAAASWNPAALKMELNHQDIGPILEEVEARKHPE
jgi:hypothetical protein